MEIIEVIPSKIIGDGMKAVIDGNCVCRPKPKNQYPWRRWLNLRGEKNSQFQTLQLRFVLPRMIPAFFRRRHFYDWDQYFSIGYGSTVIAILMDYARRGYVFPTTYGLDGEKTINIFQVGANSSRLTVGVNIFIVSDRMTV